MKDNHAGTSSPPSWDALAAKVDALIDLNRTLYRENEALRRQVQGWSRERAHLIKKHELAKSGLETLITRYKSLEQD